MTSASANPGPAIPAGAAPPLRLGAVSYLNTLPLIEGLDKLEGVDLTRAAPSRLADLLEAGRLDAALAPVIEAQRSTHHFAFLAVGMIGSDGPTFTVRLYSAEPIEKIKRVHADTDSRTSIALLRIILAERFGITPEIVSFDARERIATFDNATTAEPSEWPPAMLLIGDKVVTSSPPAVRYPHQIDLGEQWALLTGLPFVYALWMCRADHAQDAAIRAAAAVLDRQRRHNVTRLDWIVTNRAPALGWPLDLARSYIGSMLRYELGDRERDAVARFFELAEKHGVIEERRPIEWIEA
ncbi:MAG: menaquinone biosynthesis protein [Planctomycetota bacterium]|nr:menaquinone biosynthesis protein [Planctomycetota bacterium]